MADIADRASVQLLATDLAEAVIPYFSPGGARVRLGVNTTGYDDTAAELEAFARPLWGLAPLAAGGGDFTHWETYRRGLASGTDPAHPEYWGRPGDRDQRIVEAAALGFALALVPEQLWDPLTGPQRDRAAAWLSSVLDCATVENNWRFFPVLVGLGLDRVGVRYERAANVARLDWLESCALGDGWYADGLTERRRDYYVSFAMHFYGLVYAALAGERDSARAERMRARASAFAADFRHWFATDGAAVPFGRSLTYRFAHVSFWGALAFADVEALPWGEVKGYLLRNLRWWRDRTITTADGLLSVGYGYPQPLLAEQYNAPGSPYWAMKAFLPLALPADHALWTAPEQPAPQLPETSTQPHAGVVLMRCEQGRQAIALGSLQYHQWARHSEAKYAKFAYSSWFGFSVMSGAHGLAQGAFDSTLALSDDGGEHYRTREVPLDPVVHDGLVYCRWRPWPDVDVETWVQADPPWHVRVHHIRSPRALVTAEGAFAVDRDTVAGPPTTSAGPGHARISGPTGLCVIDDLDGDRTGQLVAAFPGTNVMARRTVIPTLLGTHPPGEFWLACAVLGLADAVGGGDGDGWPQPPRCPERSMLLAARSTPDA
ncbi:DUF2264 domain-containing protein [Streptomyces gardneri]|nr:DUF2264 domain-containing protein [Streptomyces gardneri]